MELKEAVIIVGQMEDNKIDGKPDLDPLDYHWFLVSLIHAQQNGYILELLDDATGSYKKYLVYNGSVDDEDLSKLELTLLPVNDKSSKVQHLFDIEKVEDARIVDGYKYYVSTSSGRYRFLIFTR